MTNHLPLLAAAVLLIGTTSAFAASSTDLSVVGTIMPSACAPSLSNGGVVDYGKISAKDLNQSTNTPLGEKTLQLTVTCDAITPFALSLTDNRPDTATDTDPETFGLGLTDSSEKLGRYEMFFRNPVADTSLRALYSANQGGTWNFFGANESAQKTDWIAFGENRAPLPLQTVTVDLAISTEIAPSGSLTLTSEVKMDGSATLQMEYL